MARTGDVKPPPLEKGPGGAQPGGPLDRKVPTGVRRLGAAGIAVWKQVTADDAWGSILGKSDAPQIAAYCEMVVDRGAVRNTLRRAKGGVYGHLTRTVQHAMLAKFDEQLRRMRTEYARRVMLYAEGGRLAGRKVPGPKRKFETEEVPWADGRVQ